MQSVGGSRKLRYETYKASGELADPEECTLTITAPDGTVETRTVEVGGEGAEAGRFAEVIEYSLPGFWQWAWSSSGGDAMPKVSAGATLVGGAEDAPRHAWCSVVDVLETSNMKKVRDAPDTIDAEMLDRCCRSATEFLHRRTWRRFKGLQAVELRPCCQHQFQTLRDRLVWPAWGWVPAEGGGQDNSPPPIVDESSNACGCSSLAEFWLPNDTRLVLRVMIDGEEFTHWRLDSGRRLLRTDGQAWPCCQDITADDTEDDTFSVHIVVGAEDSELARLAAIDVTAELYLYLKDPSACRIPTKVTTVQQQGQTVQMVQQSSLNKDGTIGLRIADLFLSAFGQQEDRSRRISIAGPDDIDESRRVGFDRG